MIKTPYYKQTTEMTCGPAALMMLLKFYKKKIKLNRKIEFKIWRDAVLLGWRAVGLYGIATAALKNGLKVELLREKKAVWKDFREIHVNQILEYIFKQQESEAKKLGLKEKIGEINIDLLRSLLKKGIPPMVLIREIKPDFSLQFAHWVIVVGINDDFVYINDSIHGKNRKIPVAIFESALYTLHELNCNFGKEVLAIQRR